MLTRRSLLMSLGATAVVAPLAACGGNTTPGASEPATEFDKNTTATLTMTWWGNDDRAERYRQAIAEFNKEYPNITVQSQFQPFGDYWTARNTEAAGGALPDVWQMDLSYLRQFANNNLLLPLDNQVGSNLDVSGMEDTVLEAGRLNGNLFAIATGTNTLATFYHPEVLSQLGMEAPTEGFTWEDYKQSVMDGARAGASHDPKLYFGGTLGGTLWFFVQWLVQKGITPFNDDNTLGFGEDEVREWLMMWDELNTDEFRYPTGRAEQLKPKNAFTAMEMATQNSWDNFLAGYFADSGSTNVQMLPMPSGDDGKPHMFFKPAMLLCAGANTQQPDAAAALISFMVNNPEVGRIFGTSKGVPATKAQRDAMDLEAGSADERVTQFEVEVADLVTAPTPVPVEGFGAIEAEWLRLSEDYGYDAVTVDQWVDQWFQAVRENGLG